MSLNIGQNYCFDATRKADSYARLINHGNYKEANIRPHRPLMVDGRWRLGFYALRNISAGEELLYDYGAGHIRESPAWMKTRRQTSSVVQTYIHLSKFHL